jgi:hypothetical protein
MAKAPPTPTKPQAGVMTTKPLIKPVAKPKTEGLPLMRHSIASQTKPEAEAAAHVFNKAKAATPLASKADPALKPNQPNNNKAVPTKVSVTLCGCMASLP